MNIKKSMLIADVANDLGANLEDRVESEQKTASALAGGAEALKQAAIKVPRDLAARADNDQNIKDGMSEPEVRKMVKEYLTRTGDFLQHLSAVEQQKAITQGGIVDGLRQAMVLIQKRRDAETTKLKQMIALAEQEDASTPGAEVPRTAAEAARTEHGSAAERKAAAETEKITKKKKATKKKATKTKATKKKATKTKAATKAATG
jgi:hypothetical protein